MKQLHKRNVSGISNIYFDNNNKSWTYDIVINKKRHRKYFRKTKDNKSAKQLAIEYKKEYEKRYINNQFSP